MESSFICGNVQNVQAQKFNNGGMKILKKDLLTEKIQRAEQGKNFNKKEKIL